MSERPTVLIDGLHVRYRVIMGSATRSAAGALRTMVTGKSPSQLAKSVHAVRGVDFTAYEGDVIGLIGRNGSGKSSLLKAVAGLLRPSEGDVYTASPATMLGVGAALNKALSGNRNITLGGLAMGLDRDEIERLRPSIIEFSGLGGAIDLPMGTYSSGMKTRLRFAIAASREHDILLVDEALSTGDTEFRRRSLARLRELSQNAGTVFIVAHGHGMIRELCNRAIWMDQGVIRLTGSPADVVDAYEADMQR